MFENPFDLNRADVSNLIVIPSVSHREAYALLEGTVRPHGIVLGTLRQRKTDDCLPAIQVSIINSCHTELLCLFESRMA